ncbi:ABC transporter permease [Enterococcus sp. HY326]|uniref:ABC transporter permease n=1 Tax=Enterococcus sp. HY326 TaxID=2971265 RepID=UPI00223F10C7|nr:ABC transporter permease [Enterococcus sp. HY326]
MFLAIKEMKYAKLRYSLIIGIMVLVGYVVFMLSGLADGLASGHTKVVTDWQASEIVLSEDANKVATASQLTAGDIDRVSTDDENKAAVSIFSGSISENADSDDKTNITVFGADQTSFVVPEVTSGTTYTADDEIVISQNLADQEGYQVGDTVSISNDESLTIVGIIPSSSYNVAPIIYTSLATEAKIKYGDQDFGGAENIPVNLIVVQNEDNVTVTNADGDTKIEAIDEATFIENIPGYSAESLTLNSMIAFLFVVVAAIVGIFMYVMTLQKTSLFGVMKAQGVATKYIVRSIIAQAFFVGLFGVIIAFALSYGTSFILPAAMPFAVDLIKWVGFGGILIVVAVLGGVFSIRTVTKVDPITAIGGE